MVDVPGSSSGVTNAMQLIAGFDVSTRDGRAALLSGIRDSSLTAIEKAEARDLLFAYSHAGNEAIGSLLGVLLDKGSVTAPVVDQGVGAPEMPAPQAGPVSADPASPEPTPAAMATPAAAVGDARPTPQFAPASAPAAPIPEETTAPETPSATPLIPPVAEAPAPAPIPETAAPVEGATSDSVSAVPASESSSHLDRIKEIKHAINEKVGNPVALIDANNQVGREYMDALLEAMKSVNSADGANAEAAMQRLEGAYTAVEKMLAEGPPPNTPPAPQSAAEVIAPSTPATAVPDTPITTDAASAVTPEPVDVAPPTPAAAPTPATMSTAPAEVSTPETPTPSAAPAPQAALAQSPAAPSEVSAPTTEDSRDAELHTPEISAGLNQLLSEWNIFKTSGFLGTGPSGADHPLYGVVKDLPMTAIVTGRFEGGTPEVKQSISDYMKGWRYEQDVSHTQAETFEHYLRRVVKRILHNAKVKAATGQGSSVAA